MAFIKIWRTDQKFYREAKAKRVHHHETSFTRNVTGTYLSEKEKATTRKMKITEGKKNLKKKKNLIVKVKYTIKVVNQPCIKLVKRLKDKSSKIYTQ